MKLAIAVAIALLFSCHYPMLSKLFFVASIIFQITTDINIFINESRL
jgi:hypothetical protein